MKHYTHILFDLDGTLTDPKTGITKSVAYALRSFGIEADDLDALCKFIGPPLKESFLNFYGLSEEEGTRAVAKYREYFGVTGIFENEVYPGIEECLRGLKKQGKHLLVATSKPTVYAVQILEHFGLKEYFDFIAGSEFDGTRTKKADVINYALKQAGITDRSRAVMVGDREHDILGAKEAGIDSIGVLYGYGDRQEHEAAGAGQAARSVQELYELLAAQ